jgi:hypothetical protein
VARDTWAVLIDPETVPSIDPGAARMLRALADNVEREGRDPGARARRRPGPDVLERADSEGPGRFARTPPSGRRPMR